MKMNFVATLVVAASFNVYCMEQQTTTAIKALTGEITLPSQKEFITYPSCTRQAPSNMPNVDRSAPLVEVVVVLEHDKKRVAHFLPVSLFQNKDGSFKRAGDQIVVCVKGQVKEFDAMLKLSLDESFKKVDLKNSYEQFRAAEHDQNLGCLAVLCCFNSLL